MAQDHRKSSYRSSSLARRATISPGNRLSMSYLLSRLASTELLYPDAVVLAELSSGKSSLELRIVG